MLDQALEHIAVPFDDTATDALDSLLRTWDVFCRPAQARPEDAREWWNVQAGRFFGKTRAIAEHTLDMMEAWGPLFTGGVCNKTTYDVLSTNVNGVSGLITCAKWRGYELEHYPSKRLLVHPAGGTIQTYSGDVAGGARGFSGNYFWLDELPHYKYAEDVWDNVALAVREPAPPPGGHGIISSTPLRRSIISSLLRQPDYAAQITTTRGGSAANVGNIDIKKLAARKAQFGSSWKGRQELDGEDILDENSGFTLALIESLRMPVHPSLNPRTLGVSVDPAVTSDANSDESGIVGGGSWDMGGEFLHHLVLADRTMTSAPPPAVAREALELAGELEDRYGILPTVWVEDNQGKETWDEIFSTAGRSLGLSHIPVERHHATQAKEVRADAAAAIYQERRVHHIGAPFHTLEKQMHTWAPGMKSPDRMDALVHLVLKLEAQSAYPSLFGRDW